MRAGGTLKGMEDLMKEFEAKVIAKAVFMELKTDQKDTQDYFSLMTLNNAAETDVSISENFLEKFTVN